MTYIFATIFVILLLCIVTGKKNSEKQIILPDAIIGHGNSDIIITSVNNNAIEILKELRSITGYSLYETKNIIEHLPFKIMQNVEEEYAQSIKSTLEIAGAKVEIRESEIRM